MPINMNMSENAEIIYFWALNWKVKKCLVFCLEILEKPVISDHFPTCVTTIPRGKAQGSLQSVQPVLLIVIFCWKTGTILSSENIWSMTKNWELGNQNLEIRIWNLEHGIIVCDCVDVRDTLVLTSQSSTSSTWPSRGFPSRTSGRGEGGPGKI